MKLFINQQQKDKEFSISDHIFNVEAKLWQNIFCTNFYHLGNRIQNITKNALILKDNI